MENLTLRFRLGRIPIEVEPLFWLMAFVMGSNLRGPAIVLWVLVVFVSIIVHELGHALASMAFGARAKIKLHSMGGLTFPDRKLTRSQEIIMTLAGPFAGFALAAVAYAIVWQFPTVLLTPNAGLLLSFLVSVNFWWGVMNLLPVPPLDGGHVALALGGPRRHHAVRVVAVAVAGLVVVWSVMDGAMYRAVLFGLLGYQNLQMMTRTARG